MKRLPGRFGKITGFSLVEMMISIVIGLVVVGGVISIFASAIKSHTDNLRMTRLNQELRVVMNMMVRDIRRAGFWGGNNGVFQTLGPPFTSNPFGGGIPISPTGDCITFSYDADNSGGSPAASENLGFRLNGGAVQTRISAPSCSAGLWRGITDPNAVVITGLTFTLTPAATVDIDGAATTPCPPRVPPPPGCAPGGTRSIPTLGVVTVQEINITLSGQLASDTSVTRTIRETVRVYQ